jgi:hypothetical protein
VFDEGVSLPDGTEVEVVLSEHEEENPAEGECPTLYEQLKDVVGIAQGLPSDFAENHDHYIHGCPKKAKE